MISGDFFIIDGVSVGKEIGYKTADGSFRPGLGAVPIGADGTPRQVSLAAALTDAPAAYVYTSAVFGAGNIHINGTVTPVYAIVHLSTVVGDVSPEALLHGELASVQADSEGVWSCDVQLPAVGLVYAWVNAELSIPAAMSTSVSIETGSGPVPPDPPGPEEPGPPVPEEPRAYTISTEFEAVANIINNNPSFSFNATVTGPMDLANVKLYAENVDMGGEILLPVTVTGKNGEYGMTAQWDNYGTPYTKFRAEGGTNDPAGMMTVNVVGYDATCLSGDTLITLADGTSRRLDELTGGELVLGGDMQPAHIVRLSRGLWSSRHTLYHFDGGIVIDETHEHRFYNADQGFWQKLKNWSIGDHARHLDGSMPELEAVEPVEERAEMFGLWVERGSYWANGLLSGDASANRALLADATVEQAADMAASLAERDLMQILGLEGLLP